MNLLYGQIDSVFADAGQPMARLRVRGVLTQVSLALTPEAQPGDDVLVCDGVVLSKVREQCAPATGEPNHVSGDSRKNS